MSQPTVSILIPTYNRQDLITETVQSALSQTYQDFEIVIVDNQSTDNTYQVCLDLAKTDSRIRVYQNEENIGPVRNWQRCVELAHGEYAKILFSDDLIHPTFLEKTVNLLADPSVGYVFTGVLHGQEYFLDWDKGKSRNLLGRVSGCYDSQMCIRKFLFGQANTGTPSSAIFRIKDLERNLLESIPSPSISDFAAHGAGVDILPMLLTANSYPKIGYISEALTFFRGHKNSISIIKGKQIKNCYHQAMIWFVDQLDDEILGYQLKAVKCGAERRTLPLNLFRFPWKAKFYVVKLILPYG